MMPEFPTRNELSKLSRAEITERLQAFGLEWTVFRDFEDTDDPFLTKPTGKQPTRQEQEFACNVMHLHRAPLCAWIDSLTSSQIEKIAKEYKIDFSPWFKRKSTITKLRREFLSRLPEHP
jgi:hypothetical protein